MPKPITIAYFITPHGFGHASRGSAVMAAVMARAAHVKFEIITTSPKEIFAQSLPASFGYHSKIVDIGIIQTTPLREDLEATDRALAAWLPLKTEAVRNHARRLEELSCDLVVCDISPLGIEAARKAGIPSLLVENFTWAWIYKRYAETAPRLMPHGEYLQTIYDCADHHIQSQPLCQPYAGASQVLPISRKPRCERRHIRKLLNIPENGKLILVSMGGVPDQLDFIKNLPQDQGLYFVLPAAPDKMACSKNVIALPAHSDFYHPDLMLAADLLIGKVGYSTIAEANLTGTPFGYVTRPNSPESKPLEGFLTAHMSAGAISATSYETGTWIDQLPQLLELPRRKPAARNGADQVAEFILDLVK